MTYITYVDDENPLMRFKRRASTVGDAVGGFVKSIRRTSGSLRRSVSKAFGFNNVQEVTRIGNGERKGFMAGEETDNEATGPEFGEVVWNRVHREI